MSLQEQLLDLTIRMRKVEKEFYPQIDALNAQIQAVNAHYNRLKGKEPNLWMQSIAIVFACFGLLLYIVPEMFGENPGSAFTAAMLAIVAAVTVLNVVRAKIMCLLRKKRAMAWWEKNGKPQVLSLNASMQSIEGAACQYACQNSLIKYLPDCWLTEKDCHALYKIVVQRRAASLEEAMYVYDDILEAEHQREMDREERRRAVEEITRRQEELQRSMDRAERQRDWTNLQLDDIRYHIKYDD